MTFYKGESVLNEYIPIISHKNSILLNRIRVFATWSVLLGHGFSYCQITIFKDQTHFAYIQNFLGGSFNYAFWFSNSVFLRAKKSITQL